MKKTSNLKVFNKNVCTDEVIKKYMSSYGFRKYNKLKTLKKPFDNKTIENVANAIKKWAIVNEISHFSHIFFPLNDILAEKQVSIIDKTLGGKPIDKFDAKSLIKSEVDGSSFPNGDERNTAKARGYALWDYDSPIFFKTDESGDKTMYIPAIFCSYLGNALDYKTPLLRAVESLNTQAVRVLKFLGMRKVKRVEFNIGAEQEFFLMKSEHIEKRLDLKLVGRTILGGKPIMSQKIFAHYFTPIKTKISQFFHETNTKLWEMGIMTKIQHSEVAPCQYELVPIFNKANISCDQNAILMQTIRNVANKNGFTAIFHEKPFDCFNGSGKHINWSLSTNSNLNLFDIESVSPIVFFTFFIATIVAVDKYYKLLRYSTAYHSNDFRLGGHEAPPPIISVFTSEYILKRFSEIEKSEKISTHPFSAQLDSIQIPKLDFCDRNRTSPFAFTGNKFEFRMVGSSQSISFPATCICTTLADVLRDIADSLSNNNDIIPLLKQLFNEHKKIIFNGSSYDDEWVKEAKRRGFINYENTPEVLNILLEKDIINLFDKTGVLREKELEIRHKIHMEEYINSVMLEAKIMIEMISKQILPALNKSAENNLNNELTNAKAVLTYYLNELKALVVNDTMGNAIKLGKTMRAIRKVYDKVEGLIPYEHMPFPTVNEIVF